MTKRNLLVTAALPYANGPIHLGHLVEYIQTDIWVRFQNLRGNRCVFVCADDTHGTSIMISAQKAGVTEQEFIDRVHVEHERDLSGFGVQFDNFGSTHCEENREICGEIWQKIREAGLVDERDVTQLFDPEKGVFLADRFVKGTCPKCKSPDQFGDNCANCGETYAAEELIDPVSVHSGAKPELKSAKHLFIQIEKLHDFLTDYTQNNNHLPQKTANYLQGHFLNEPLRDWDISRPAPYWGFEIPDAPGHYWFVWFDAPIGYIASTKQWCDKNGEKLEDWWKSDQTEIHHFIGKDIAYFHTLFWPAMLKTAGLTLPTRIHIHGFLTVNGRKMSKRDGTFIKAATYLNHLDPAFLRYYFASKLGSDENDFDLNFDEFVAKVNSDLVGKVVNLASRTGKFAHATGLSPSYPEDGGLFAYAAEQAEPIAEAYETGDYNRAMRLIMELADRANPFVEEAQPWKLKKDPDKADELRDVCTVALNLFRQIVVYLSPVLPKLAEQTSELLQSPITHWDDAQTPLTGSAVSKFSHMLARVQEKDIVAMTEETKADSAPEPDPNDELVKEPLAEECTIDDFVKVDLRVAEVISAEHVEGADKLLKLTLSLGGEHTRQVFAGIKAAYEPEALVGKLVVMCANLKPRKMKFGLSEGMVCAAGPGKSEVYVLGVDSGAKPGQRVH